MFKQGGELHLSQISQDYSYMKDDGAAAKPFNQTALLSFEKDFQQQEPSNVNTFAAATGEFKSANTDSSAEGAFCQLGSGQVNVFGATKTDTNEIIMGGDNQTSFFCNDKSGISMVEAFQER